MQFAYAALAGAVYLMVGLPAAKAFNRPADPAWSPLRRNFIEQFGGTMIILGAMLFVMIFLTGINFVAGIMTHSA